jgi:hypothetical protein
MLWRVHPCAGFGRRRARRRRCRLRGRCCAPLQASSVGSVLRLLISAAAYPAP